MAPEPDAGRPGGGLTVVGAVIVHDGLVLCAQRDTGALAGLWEFPGGKVEDGESQSDALAREIEEELGCRIRVGAPVITVRHAYDFATVTLTTYRCELLAGTPAATEHRELRWLPPSELGGLEWAPLDIATVRLLAP